MIKNRDWAVRACVYVRVTRPLRAGGGVAGPLGEGRIGPDRRAREEAWPDLRGGEKGVAGPPGRGERRGPAWQDKKRCGGGSGAGPGGLLPETNPYL